VAGAREAHHGFTIRPRSRASNPYHPWRGDIPAAPVAPRGPKLRARSCDQATAEPGRVEAVKFNLAAEKDTRSCRFASARLAINRLD
jgi:hypothetical protein